MLDGIGKSGTGRIDAQRAALGKAAAAAPVGAPANGAKSVGVGGTIADLVASGPPVDSDKVARIRAAIAAGNYPVDANRIAEAMIALDLPK
jgi:negative regulator of flagellin synthesis FlgM